MPAVPDTITLVLAAHEGQVDKIGRPYVLHLLAVMALLGPDATPEEQMTALLHDIIEDTRIREEDLRAMGYPGSVLKSLRLLTRDPATGLTYKDYIKSIARSGDIPAIKVKLADLTHNMDARRLSVLPTAQADSLRERYNKAIVTMQVEILRGPDPEKLMNWFNRNLGGYGGNI